MLDEMGFLVTLRIFVILNCTGQETMLKIQRKRGRRTSHIALPLEISEDGKLGHASKINRDSRLVLVDLQNNIGN